MPLLSMQITDSDDAEGLYNIFLAEPSVRPSVSEIVRPLTEQTVYL